ncbi:MAG TPA: hypothetical protein VJ866_11225 [Pyrinomonadaceae bacterium]|nr:hypothetical protein [Pyrinomonadaceae bacterium]
MRRLLHIIIAVGLVASNASAGTFMKAAPSEPAAVQCRTTDRNIPKQVRFARGRTTAVIKDTVRLCTAHEYYLRAKGGQSMTVHLATGSRTSFSVYAPTGDIIEGADGVKDWEGSLPETGQYIIHIGTDATAAYTLEVTIR